MKKKRSLSTKGSTRVAFYQAKFDGYEGRKRFEVRHPSHPPCVVAAPDENAALVAAADYNGMDWRKVSYYAYAEVLNAVEPAEPVGGKQT